MFCVSVQFLFKGVLESSIPGGMEPSSEVWWCALCNQMTWSAWVLVARARSSWNRSSSTEAMGDDFGSLCDVFQMLFVGTEKHRDMALGYSHQTQAFWDTHRCPLQATEHRPAACWSALGKIARIEGICFVLYFKGLLWPGRRAGCSWSTPCLCWCREEAEHQVQSPGMDHCAAWGMGKPPTLPQPSQAGRKLVGGTHRPYFFPFKAAVQSSFEVCFMSVDCMSLKLALASHGGWTLIESF